VELASQSEWADLYQKAMDFKEMAPWQWMTDAELFGVENPRDSEIGWCTVLGNEGLEFGLLVFLGAEGFQMYHRIITGGGDANSFEVWAKAPLLSMMFVDRQELQQQDLDLIRSLGLRFRGKNAWPHFRSHRPGYLPWYLEKNEVVFLSIIVQQAIDVAKRVHEGQLDLFEEIDADMILTRYYSAGQWLEDWRKPGVPSRRVNVTAPLDAAQLSGLRKAAKELRGSWEFDIFLLPTAVSEGASRPYYPTCVLVVEGGSGFIVGTELMGPHPTLAERQEAVIRILAQGERFPLPQEIRVKGEEEREVIEPIARALGASLRVTRLRELERARKSLFERFL
jgi:hypothetical protein